MERVEASFWLGVIIVIVVQLIPKVATISSEIHVSATLVGLALIFLGMYYMKSRG